MLHAQLLLIYGKFILEHALAHTNGVSLNKNITMNKKGVKIIEMEIAEQFSYFCQRNQLFSQSFAIIFQSFLKNYAGPAACYLADAFAEISFIVP
jgi:hypothetical protein